MAKEKKWTDNMEELRVYIVNTEWCIDEYESMAKDIAEKFKNTPRLIIGYKYLNRAVNLGRNAAQTYRAEGGDLGRLGCRQAGEVGMSKLRETAEEFHSYIRAGNSL